MASNNKRELVELSNISYSYGSLEVLKDVSLCVSENEIVALVGPSGCGKTTLLNIFSGYYKPVSGTIDVNGSVRTVYQQGSLFPWLTVAQNIGIGVRGKSKAQRKLEVNDLIALVGMQGFEHHFPHQLSGGMKQRVEIGRVLAGDSDIILLDEPFSALDYQSRLRMRKELIRVLSVRPKTVVLVTHDIDEAVQIADRVLVFTRRPITECEELQINLPHPRTSTHPELIDATRTILNKLGLESADSVECCTLNSTR